MVFYIFTLKKAENILKEVFARLIQQSSRVELGKKFEIGFYAKPDTPSPQAVPAAGEPTISMTASSDMDNTDRAKTVQKPCSHGLQNKKAMKSFDPQLPR